MSRDTKAALDHAVSAHIHDVTEGGIVTGYVMQTSYFSTSTEDNGSTGYYVEVADDQSFHIGLGLSSMLRFHYDSLVKLVSIDEKKATVSVTFDLHYRIGRDMLPGDMVNVNWATGVVSGRSDDD